MAIGDRIPLVPQAQTGQEGSVLLGSGEYSEYPALLLKEWDPNKAYTAHADEIKNGGSTYSVYTSIPANSGVSFANRVKEGKIRSIGASAVFTKGENKGDLVTKGLIDNLVSTTSNVSTLTSKGWSKYGRIATYKGSSMHVVDIDGLVDPSTQIHLGLRNGFVCLFNKGTQAATVNFGIYNGVTFKGNISVTEQNHQSYTGQIAYPVGACMKASSRAVTLQPNEYYYPERNSTSGGLTTSDTNLPTSWDLLNQYIHIGRRPWTVLDISVNGFYYRFNAVCQPWVGYVTLDLIA